jgi:hypothetical protein
MSARFFVPALILLAFVSCSAQTVPESSAPVSGSSGLTAAQDHQRMLDLLAIKDLRPGVSHDRTAPNPVNYDESKANPWPKLPDPLVLNNGKPVTSDKIWWTKRRPELVEVFDREILGRVPARRP